MAGPTRGKASPITPKFNAAANPKRPLQTPKLQLNLNPPRRSGPSLGGSPATSAVPLKSPIVKKGPMRPTQAFKQAAKAPVRPTASFNRAAAPARTQGPTRTRTR